MCELCGTDEIHLDEELPNYISEESDLFIAENNE